MDFGPAPSYLYIPYMIRQQSSYLAPSPFLYSDSPLSYLDPAYDTSQSYAKPKSQGDTGLAPHLETITQDPWLGGRRDPLDQFLAGKKTFLAKSVEDITGSIYEREHIKYDHLRKIDYDWCKTSSSILQMAQWAVGANPNIERSRISLQRELAAFEREKRMEEVACWRDVSRLKSELREVMREVAQEERRDALILGEM